MAFKAADYRLPARCARFVHTHITHHGAIRLLGDRNAVNTHDSHCGILKLIHTHDSTTLDTGDRKAIPLAERVTVL